MIWLKVFTCIVLLFETAKGNDNKNNQPVVKISAGRVQGYTSTSQRGKTYYGFQTIPYAQPPVNSLRFKPPKTNRHWEGIRNGSQLGNECPQLEVVTGRYFGVEDCLYINVYTSQLKKSGTKSLPVLVWIHGGGFLGGSGRNDLYGPQHYMDHSIVLVTFNYRLGPLGFLSTEDENAFGNYAMLDQILALQWVQKEIAAFGGDPNKVTVFGISAGSGSIFHLILSPLAKGLFHKAIPMSGSVTNHWAFIRNPLEIAKMHAEYFKCPNSSDSKAIVDCFTKLSAEDLMKGEKAVKPSFYFPINFAPTLEPKGGPGFITEDPIRLLKEGKIANRVPMIIGMTINEGYSIYNELASTFKLRGRAHFEKEFPSRLALYTPVQPNMTLAHKAIADLYYANENVDDDEVFERVSVQINGDAMFSAGISEAVELFSKAGVPTRAYILNHIGQYCLAELMGGKCGKYSSHADDYYLHFRFSSKELKRENDLAMSKILTTLWANFASDRDLTIDDENTWPIYDECNRSYVELSLTSTIKQGPLSDKMVFWTETIPMLIRNQSSNVEQ